MNGKNAQHDKNDDRLDSPDGRNGNQSALSEFWAFICDFKSVIAIVGKLAVIAPLSDLALNLGPPWPSRIGVSLLVSIVQLVVLMYSFEFWRRKRSGRLVDVQKKMKVAILITAISFVAYLGLFAFLVKDAPDRWHRVVIGFRYHRDIGDMVRSNPSLYTPEHLLDLFERQPAAVWTLTSVYWARVLMLLTWLTFWGCLSVIVASFVALQWRRR